MKPERAKWLLSHRRPGGEFPMAFRRPCDSALSRIDPLGITRAEDREIMDLWNKMPGESRYYDALRLMSLRSCSGCKRCGSECWVMPCFELEQALAAGVEAVNSWLEAVDAPFRVERKS